VWSSSLKEAMKFFLFLCLACMWNSLVLASPSCSQLIRDLTLATVLRREASTNVCFFRLLRNHISFEFRVLLSWAISSWCRISFARRSWELRWPTVFWLQLCKLLAVALNFSDSVSNGQGRAGTAVHAASTVSMNPSKLGQKASKWKRLLLVGLSCRPSKRGQWSESPEAQLCKRQSGNSCFRGAVLEQGIY